MSDSIEFDVKYSCQAYNTTRVKGQCASSTSSALAAAERLANKVFGKPPRVLRELAGFHAGDEERGPVKQRFRAEL